MKKFSIAYFNNNKLWIPLLLIGIIAYIIILYQYHNTSNFSLLQSKLDGILYQHYFLDTSKYPFFNPLFSSPIGMILFLFIELFLWYTLFNDRKLYRNPNIRALVIFVVFLLLGCIYVHTFSSFWIAQIIVFLVICLLSKIPNASLLEMLFISFLIGIAGLFYAGSFLFLLIPIIYAFEQKHWFSYILASILGTIVPVYLLISYIWLKYDEWVYLPNILATWSWHMDIFIHTLLLFIFIFFLVVGFIYLLIKQFTAAEVLKRVPKFLIGYYFVSFILFFIESNDQIAISILIPCMSILLIRNNKIN